MNGFLNDLRFGLRQLAAKPGFAVAAILTLALGIGANTAVFSVLNGYLLKPLPYPQGGELVQIGAKFRSLPASKHRPGMAMPLYFEVQDHVHALSDSAIYSTYAFNLQAGGQARRATGTTATASLFSVLGVKPLLGQVFGPANSQSGREQVVVLSYGLWQSLFGGSPDVIGKTFKLDSRVYRVVAVMPRGFAFPNRGTEFWRPLVITPQNRDTSRFGPLNYDMIGRLRPGASLAGVSQQLKSVMAFVQHSLSAKVWQQVQSLGFDMSADHYREALLGNQTTTLLLLQFAVLLVLLIACVNVANLLLSRVLGRSHELSMRAALGASRGMLARQLLVEALCLAVPGGLVGIGLGWWALMLIGHSGLVSAGAIFDFTPDWRVGLFALGVVCFTAMLVSLAPIQRLGRTDLQTLLQEGGGQRASGGRRARRIRNTLVVVELVLATGLLAGAGLLLHSFVNLQTTDTGFSKDNVLVAGLLVPRKDHAGDAALSSFYKSVLTKVEALPGAASASVASCAPLCRSVPGEYVRMRGYKAPPGAAYPTAGKIVVDGAYFRSLDIPILRGRAFDARDTANSQLVAVINQALARQYFGGKDPIGRQIFISDPGKWYTIVGVVPSVKIQSVHETVPKRMIYVSAAQDPERTMYLVIKTAVPPGVLVSPLRQLLTKTDPAVAVFNVQTMHSRLADTLRNQRATMILIIAFGVIALTLAIIGVYGVMSYAVGQRRTECGVRLALGALPEDVSWLILKDGLRLLAVGVAIGLGLAVLFGYLMSAKLFDVAPFDPVTLIGSAAVLFVITLAACWLPARRAAKLDPAIAMTDH
ncbi:MAG TPA: ABC transporter permease [Gammaproteobacteria bacterium]|nr:ABC transporter permease [Gammaproteobacteria bacterium]